MIVISLIVWPPLELINLFLGPFSSKISSSGIGIGLPEISVLVVWKFGKDGSEEREEKKRMRGRERRKKRERKYRGGE